MYLLLLEPSAYSEKNNEDPSQSSRLEFPLHIPHTSISAEPLHCPKQSSTAFPPQSPKQSLYRQLPSLEVASGL